MAGLIGSFSFCSAQMLYVETSILELQKEAAAMRTNILYSALISGLLATVGLMATPDQSFAERYSSSPSENPHRYQPRADNPRADRSRTDSPRVNRSRADRPRTDSARVNRPRADRPRTDSARVNRPRADRRRTGSARVNRPRADRPRTDSTRVNRSSTDRSRTDSTRANRSRTDRSRVVRPRVNRPRADGPRVVRPRSDRYRYDHDRYRSKRSYRPWRHIPGYRYYREPWYTYPRRHYYPRYHHFYRDDDFWGWLAFTAITLAIIDSLNEQQQREHELAMYEALQAPMGETIQWRDGSTSGSVTVIREGTSSKGRYCREYTQEVKIGGESQQAYGTACRNPDGSWEIMD